DFHVTGVQTCALPISRAAPRTMAHVAAVAGVSTASVSRVLNAPEKVSPELRARVEAAVEKLAYVRHGSARALAARRFQTIGAVRSEERRVGEGRGWRG